MNTPARSRRRPTAVLVGLVAAVLLATVAVGVLGARVLENRAGADAAEEGRRAATELTPALLGYDWRTLDADAARIDAATTGPFAAQNRAVVASVVVPVALETRATVRAEIGRVAVVTADPERVETLVAYTQSTLFDDRIDRTEPRVARVLLEPDDDGRWLVAGFDVL